MPETIGDRLVRGNKGKPLDALAVAFGWAVDGFYKLPATRWIKDLLHGTWILRHPLHPAITDAVVGAYTAVAVLDVVYLVQRDASLARATDIAMAVALASSAIAILSGLTDWSSTYGNERRLGILHGVLMALISVGYLTSFWIRVSGGAREPAVYLGLGLFVLLALTAHLGGEMTYGFGTGVTRQAWTRVGTKWETLELRSDGVAEGALVEAKISGGVSVLLIKVDGALLAITNVCTHAGCMLHKGTLLPRAHVQCPCHGSVFDVRTGTPIHGPATMSETTFETRVATDGRIELMRR